MTDEKVKARPPSARRALLLADAAKLEAAYEVLGRRSSIGQASATGQTLQVLAALLRDAAATA